ncbi:MAG: cytochrome b/b6 domain-containing protein, partial [Gammaproteobacteria bacterium]
MDQKNEIKVWDILVRIFHWSLVIAFFIAYFTGEEENNWHIYAGYTVLGLISFRVIWGFIGTKHARFSGFIYSPQTVFQYFKGLLRKHPKHYLGHNPAGGWMVLLLLTSLFVVTVSGLKVYALEEGKGPLASSSELTLVSDSFANGDEYEYESKEDHDEEEEFWEEIHEGATNFTLLLIALHIIGVIVSSKYHNENLIKA